MTVAVAGHVCLDVIPALAQAVELRPGQLVTAGPAALATGGAVANVGIALHRLGVPVRLIGKLGDDLFGHAVLDALRAYHHGLGDGMVVAAGEVTSYSIVISPPGVDRSFLHCPGANDNFTAADVPDAALAGVRIFHFGYPPLMRRMQRDGGAQLEALLTRARTAGAVTALDLSEPDPHSGVDWARLLARVLGAVDVFAPSLDELLLMLDRPAHERLQAGIPPDRALLGALAERALDLGAAVVVLKLGDEGLYLRTGAGTDRMCAALGLDAAAWREREVLAPCFAARRFAGTTGTGDCTIAGLLAALLRGEDPVSAATSATAVGACCVEAPDATGGIPPWHQVADRLAAGWPRLPLDAGLAAGAWQVDARGTLVAS